MTTYTIRHEETLVGYFDVEASSERKALEEFMHQVEEGKIDFSRVEMVSSSDSVEPREDDECQT